MAALVFCPRESGAVDLASLQAGAVKNRGIVARRMAELAKSKAADRIARSRFLPRVDLGYTANLLDAPTLYEDRENSVLTGEISWNIFNGFRDQNELAAAELRREAAELKFAGVRQDIRLGVALRYLDIYEARAALKVAGSTHETLARVYRDAQKRFAVGLVAKNNLLKFKVDLDHAAIAHKKAQARLSRAGRLLAREAGLSQVPVGLEFAEFADLPKLPAGVGPEAIAHRSDISGLHRLQAAAQRQKKAESSRYLPRLDLKSGYRKYDDDLLNGNGDNVEDEYRTSLTFTFNLFDGFGRSSYIDQAGAEIAGLAGDIRELEAELAASLANLRSDYRVSVENVALAASGLAQAEENLRVTRLKYDEGLETESDLLDAIANRARANYDLIAARSEVFANYFKIMRMIERL